MDREVIRILIFVSLVFLLVGDFAAIFAPFLQMIGLDGEEAPVPKAQTLRTPNGQRESSGEETNRDGEILGMGSITKSTLMATIRDSCLPKLICELNATPHRERLSESERSLLGLIKDTTLGTTAEVTSKYHFAAHMGQLIAGIEGTGCHNFYPACPFPVLQVLQVMKKLKIR